ncbi:MAG: rRNA maturation RNase YbeY [Candidatus Omnitrophota bacterium]
MKIEITNHQKIKKISPKKLSYVLRDVYELLGIRSKRISFLLCDNTLITSLNQKFLHRRRVTDVIAFILDDEFDPGYLGEVVVSVEEAVRQAKCYGVYWYEEMLLYLIHGILHLLGYDDIKKKDRDLMRQKEKYLLGALRTRVAVGKS